MSCNGSRDSSWRRNAILYHRTKANWQLRLGPWKALDRPFGSQSITWIFLCDHRFASGFGARMNLTDRERELGIAITFGAIFVFGSFLTQFWAVAVQREHEIKVAYLERFIAEPALRRPSPEGESGGGVRSSPVTHGGRCVVRPPIYFG